MEWVCNFFGSLLDAKNIASFATTASGVFLGFFLSVRHYNKMKKEANIELELTYISLIKKEFQNSLTAFNVSYKNIDDFLYKHGLADENGKLIEFDRITDKKVDEELIKDKIVHITLYLDSMVTDNALLSASRAGATEVILLDEVVNAYNSSNIAISKAKMYADKFSAAIASALVSEESNVDSYLNILMELRSWCMELKDAYHETVKALDELEDNIKNR